MRKVMYPVSVSSTAENEVEIKQEWSDINEPDPIIRVSNDQAGLLATWIIDAVKDNGADVLDGQLIPFTLHGNGMGGEEKRRRWKSTMAQME